MLFLFHATTRLSFRSSVCSVRTSLRSSHTRKTYNTCRADILVVRPCLLDYRIDSYNRHQEDIYHPHCWPFLSHCILHPFFLCSCIFLVFVIIIYLTLQSDFQRSSTTNQQTALRRKKKKNKRLDTTTSGIFVRRGVSSPRTIHCLDKD